MSFESLLGPLYVGAMMSTLLFGIELDQAWKYFQTQFASDRLFIRSAVILAVSLDVVCTTSTHAMVYEYSVKHWGDVVYVNYFHPVALVYLTCVMVTCAIVQVFLVIRYWKLSRNRLITTFLLILLVVTIIGSLYDLYTNFSFVIHVDSYSDFNTLAAGAKIWLTFNIAMDMAVAVCLVIHLVRQDATIKSTKRLVHRLVVMAIKSGSITALWTIAIFVSYLWDIKSYISVAFVFSLGRIYTLTMFYNLNTRQLLRDHLNTVIISSSWSQQCDGFDRSDPITTLPLAERHSQSQTRNSPNLPLTPK